LYVRYPAFRVPTGGAALAAGSGRGGEAEKLTQRRTTMDSKTVENQKIGRSGFVGLPKTDWFHLKFSKI
jgi:hypothetical protein